MDRAAPYRNIAIVLALAAAADYLPGGGRATLTLEAALEVALAVGLGYFAFRFYRERQLSIYGLGERYRPLAYCALALAVVLLAAKVRMWQTGLGEFAWFALLGFVIYALIATYRFSRTY